MISSVIEECQSNIGKLEKHLMIKAFPYEDKNRPDYIQLKREYREGIYKYAGIAIFMFGNKESDAGTILADGVYEEYKIALESGAYIIPIGSTGYMAKKIWDEVRLHINDFPYLKEAEDILQNCTNPNKVIDAVLSVVNIIQTKY